MRNREQDLIKQELRVCLFTDADVFAGTERHMLDLACGLREIGVSVRIACPRPSPLASKADDAGLDVLAVSKGGLVDSPAVRVLAEELRKGNVRIIHAHNGRTALIAALSVQVAGRGRCVTTQHFLEPSHAARRGLKALPSRLAHRWVSAKMQHTIAISQAVGRSLLDRGEAPPGGITVVPNGLSCGAVDSAEAASLRREFGVPEAAPLIVCVARLEPEKGLRTLLQALAELLTSRPDVRALVVGDGSQRQALQEAAGELGIADAVRFTGFRDDARAAIAASDVFVLPSPAEPFGLVLLEAMALGRAVVAVNAGGPQEIVVDGETGRLVPANDPQALADTLAGLIARPAERLRMGRAGRGRYQACYTTRQMAERTLAVYKAALGADMAGRDL